MFERYNVNDLYIASINVMYSESAEAYEIDFGGILKMGLWVMGI